MRLSITQNIHLRNIPTEYLGNVFDCLISLKSSILDLDFVVRALGCLRIQSNSFLKSCFAFPVSTASCSILVSFFSLSSFAFSDFNNLTYICFCLSSVSFVIFLLTMSSSAFFISSARLFSSNEIN